MVWSPWAHCPPDNFVSTLHIQYSSKPGQGYTAPKPLIGLQFTCTNRSGSSSGKDRVAVWNPKKSKSVDSSKSSCLTSEFHGLLTGLQFRQSVLHENSVMQKSILDVTIYCDDTIEMRQRKFVSRNSAVWNNSHWEEPLLCGWGEFVCAGRVLVDNGESVRFQKIFETLKKTQLHFCFKPPTKLLTLKLGAVPSSRMELDGNQKIRVIGDLKVNPFCKNLGEATEKFLDEFCTLQSHSTSRLENLT